MTRVLMLINGAARRRGADGAAAPAGYWVGEVLDSYLKLRARNVDVTVATPDGTAPEADPISLDPRFHYEKADLVFAKAMARASMRAAEDIRIDLDAMTERQAIVARRAGHYLLAADLPPAKVQSILEAAMAAVLRREARLIDALLEQREVANAADRKALEGILQSLVEGARSNASLARTAVTQSTPLSSPRSLAELLSDDHDAIVVCGAAGSLPDNAAASDVSTTLDRAHRMGTLITLLSHGTAEALLAGRGPDGRWIFDGFVMTGPVDEERKQLNAAFTLDCENVESRLKNRGAVFHAAEAWAPYVSVDRTVITAQNYLSAAPAVDVLLGKLS